jgi:cell division initiation protein
MADERKRGKMITVKDIREKDFSKQKLGYNEDEVDDFLDEIADQLEILIRENRALSQQVDELKDEAREAREERVNVPTPPPEEKPVQYAPPVPVAQEVGGDEPSYFRNLETTLRETLISAQRVADETVSDARKKAKQIITSAEEQSASMLTASRTEVEGVKKEFDGMRKSADDYKKRFVALVQEQLILLKEEDSLFV